MKKLLICLSLSTTLLTGCGLFSGGPSENTSGNTGMQTTVPDTTPAAFPDTVPAGTITVPVTIPNTIPNTIPGTLPDTIPGTSGVTAPVTSPDTQGSSTEPLDSEEQAQFILAQSANAMLKADSYEYTQTSISDFGDSQITYVTEAVMFPVKGDGMITREEAGFRNTTYLKDNVMYREDTSTGDWVYLPMEPVDDSPVVIHERVNGYMEVMKTEDGFVVSSTRPLDLLEFYSITGIEEKEQETIQILKEQGVSLETMVEIWLDEEYRCIKVIHDQVTTSAGVSTGTLDEYEYRNYGSAPAVTVPQEVLDEAVEYLPEFDDPEEP